MPFKPFFTPIPSLIKALSRVERAYGFIEAHDLFEERNKVTPSLKPSIGEMISNLHLDNLNDQIAYRQAFAILVAEISGEIDSKLICHVHKKLFLEIAKDASILGTYRKSQNCIYDALTKKVLHTPTEATKIHQMMEELIEWLKNERSLPSVLMAGIFFYQFVKIHPFIDGNGRTAQVISMLILERAGYRIKDLFAIGEYYISDSKKHYNALLPKNNLTDWLLYFVDGFATQLEEVKQLLSVSYKAKNRPKGPDTNLLKSKFVFHFTSEN